MVVVSFDCNGCAVVLFLRFIALVYLLISFYAHCLFFSLAVLCTMSGAVDAYVVLHSSRLPAYV